MGRGEGGGRNGGMAEWRKVLAACDEELADGPPWRLTTVGLGQDRGSQLEAQLFNAPTRGKEYTGAKPTGPSVTRLYPKLSSAARKIFTRPFFGAGIVIVSLKSGKRFRPLWMRRVLLLLLLRARFYGIAS